MASVQWTVSGETITPPTRSTATNSLPVKATSCQTPVPEYASVQVTASVDLRMVCDQPTATKTPFPNATACKSAGTDEVREVQVVPSVDVRMVPPAPTAANCEPPNVTPRRLDALA